MKSVPILKSKRCILRDVTDEDLCIIQEIMHDNEFQKFLPELYELINSKEGFLQFFKYVRMEKAFVDCEKSCFLRLIVLILFSKAVLPFLRKYKK